MTKGNHWDVSDGDLDLGEGDSLGGADVSGGELKLGGIEIAKSEDDEIEYMPPKVPGESPYRRRSLLREQAHLPVNVEQPWTPEFDMPDYKVLGRALFRVAHGERIDDTADQYYAQDIELQIDVQQLLVDSGAFTIPSLDLPDIGEL